MSLASYSRLFQASEKQGVSIGVVMRYGLSKVKEAKCFGNRVVDVFNGTSLLRSGLPLLDIQPYASPLQKTALEMSSQIRACRPLALEMFRLPTRPSNKHPSTPPGLSARGHS